LFESKDEDATLKIIDFGLSKILEKEKHHHNHDNDHDQKKGKREKLG
jgi:hypothetical protein